jgi:hypothetical protein
MKKFVARPHPLQQQAHESAEEFMGFGWVLFIPTNEFNNDG